MTQLVDLKITSTAFTEGNSIPSLYTCEGQNFNPPLNVDNIPAGTKTLAIIMEDPDAPKNTFNHWLAWNIPPEIKIDENRVPGISGKNSAGKTGYYGPCPPTGSHRYYFHVFALNAALDIEAGTERETVEAVMKPHILAKGSLMGRYQKTEKLTV